MGYSLINSDALDLLGEGMNCLAGIKWNNNENTVAIHIDLEMDIKRRDKLSDLDVCSMHLSLMENCEGCPLEECVKNKKEINSDGV